MKNIVVRDGLEYISQSDNAYTVKSYAGEVLNIPKPYAQNIERDNHHNFHDKWVKIAALGLPLGGLLTIIFSPLVFLQNIALLRKENLKRYEQIHAKNSIVFSVILFLLGIGLFVLFIMHLIY